MASANRFYESQRGQPEVARDVRCAGSRPVARPLLDVVAL
jgi:hypothetical protein